METHELTECGLGADVRGIDLVHLSDADFEALEAAWNRFGVLRIRDQRMDPDSLCAFSARFGPLEEAPLGLMPEAIRRRIKNRFVTVISNIKEEGRPIGGLGSGEANWHSDMTYIDNPPPASVLYAEEVPPVGGDTWFADQAAALRALPTALRARIEGLQIKHDAAHTSVGGLRPGYETPEDATAAPGAVHPAIRQHEVTGVDCLYLGRREWAHVPGMSLEESDALLDELWQYAALPENVWKQQWRVGDVIIWDNRRVLHRRDSIPPEHRRLMRRCQVLAPAA